VKYDNEMEHKVLGQYPSDNTVSQFTEQHWTRKSHQERRINQSNSMLSAQTWQEEGKV